MRAEIVAAFEKNIAFSCLKCYNWYILKTEGEKRPCQDSHGAVGFVAHHKSRHFAPTGGENTEPILLTLDEYEVIRLVDLEQQTHEQIAQHISLAREAVARMLKSFSEDGPVELKRDAITLRDKNRINCLK